MLNTKSLTSSSSYYLFCGTHSMERIENKNNIFSNTYTVSSDWNERLVRRNNELAHSFNFEIITHELLLFFHLTGRVVDTHLNVRKTLIQQLIIDRTAFIRSFLLFG